MANEMTVSFQEHHNWKLHLENLPTISEFPDWQGDSEFACLLVPIFSYTGSTEYIERYIAKSAAWSMLTWMLNADVNLMNIPCFFYVEGNIADATIPILRENGVTDKHIKVVDYPNTEWLSKCLQPIFDKSLEKYNYITISDSDLFAMRGSVGQPLNFFESIRRSMPSGFGCRLFNDKIPYYWMPYLKSVTEYRGDTFDGDIIDQWCRTVERLSGYENIRQYAYDVAEPARPWTGIMSIESGCIHDKAWLERTCKVLGHDEGAIYAWSKKYGSGLLWDVHDIGVPILVDIIEYMVKAFHLHLQSNQINDVQFENIYYPDPCLMHNFASMDYKFYRSLGLYGGS